MYAVGGVDSLLRCFRTVTEPRSTDSHVRLFLSGGLLCCFYSLLAAIQQSHRGTHRSEDDAQRQMSALWSLLNLLAVLLAPLNMDVCVGYLEISNAADAPEHMRELAVRGVAAVLGDLSQRGLSRLLCTDERQRRAHLGAAGTQGRPCTGGWRAVARSVCIHWAAAPQAHTALCEWRHGQPDTERDACGADRPPGPQPAIT